MCVHVCKAKGVKRAPDHRETPQGPDPSAAQGPAKKGGYPPLIYNQMWLYDEDSGNDSERMGELQYAPSKKQEFVGHCRNLRGQTIGKMHCVQAAKMYAAAGSNPGRSAQEILHTLAEESLLDRGE